MVASLHALADGAEEQADLLLMAGSEARFRAALDALAEGLIR